MSMGTTGAINVTGDMLTAIKNAVEDYRQKSNALSTSLDNEVNNLIPASFSGSAAKGFKAFYTNNIKPATGDGVTNLLKAIDDITEGIQKAIPGEKGVDDKLGQENNQSTGGNSVADGPTMAN